MSTRFTFIVLATLFITACGDESADQAQSAENSGQSGMFDGYLAAIDKAKTAKSSANARQDGMEEMLGYDPSEVETRTLGMTESRTREQIELAEETGMFGAVHTSLNKARSARDMLNDRQYQLDELSGGSYQEYSDEEYFTGSADSTSQAEAVRDKLNARMRHLSEISGDEYEANNTGRNRRYSTYMEQMEPDEDEYAYEGF